MSNSHQFTKKNFIKMNLDVVKYACTCGLLKPISQLYFCRHCTQLRCTFCVCHEVDSHFCGKCSENLPSSEARLKKNRCGNCYNCPSCQQGLSTRMASKGPTNPDDSKSSNEKMYYLICLFCRWSSRDVGIPDQSSVTRSWPERENVFANRLQETLDGFKTIVLAQKQQQENYKKTQIVKYISYTDRTGITAAALRKRIGIPEMPHPLLKNKPKFPTAPTASEDVEELPNDIFVKPVNLLEVTTIEQRLLQPEVQPATVDKLFPVHKQFSIKRSLRCKSCEHNVSKPEYNPASIKFKIQLFAYYHVPDVRIVTVEPLRAGTSSELILKFTNPTQHQTTIKFFKLDLDELEPEATETVVEDVAEQVDKSLVVQEPSIVVKPRKITQELNCDVVIPSNSFILPQRDDAAEYDDSADTHNIKDDTTLVISRKSNKAFIKLIVTPNANLTIGTEMVCGFVMEHLYTNAIVSTVENKLPPNVENKIKVFLKLGNLVGSN